MSSPCGWAEQLTVLLSSLQKSFTYLRLIIVFLLRLLCSTPNNWLSSALSSWPCYFQVEWHMRGWFCLLRSLSALCIFFCGSVFCWVPLGSPNWSGLLWSALPQNEPSVVAEEQQDYFTCLCVTLLPAYPRAAVGFIGTVLLVHVCIFVYGFPTSCAFPVWNFI